MVAPEQLFLYSTTPDVRSAMEAGVPIALGADWAPSGSKNLLGEMKIARLVSQHEHGLLSDRAIDLRASQNDRMAELARQS